MLGLYENFPDKIHRIASFTFSLPLRKIQERIIQALHEMNNKAVGCEEVDQQALRDCTLVFETGVADSRSFNYLDETEASKLQEAIEREPFRIVDFFFAARYYKTEGGKKSPLKFDYFLVRAVFLANSLELRIFHERGPRYISPEDVGNFLVGRINKASSRRILKST